MILLAGVCLIASTALVAQETPKLGPEHELHGFLEGENSCTFNDGTAKFESKCEWVSNGLFMTCTGHYKPSSGSTVEFHTVQGYDRHEKVHTMYRFRSTGQIDHARGWFKDNKLKWVFSDELVDGKWQRRQLAVELNSTKNFWTFKWERSVEGGPWQVTQEGKCTKVND
jgi:hypothetical protein